MLYLRAHLWTYEKRENLFCCFNLLCFCLCLLVSNFQLSELLIGKIFRKRKVFEPPEQIDFGLALQISNVSFLHANCVPVLSRLRRTNTRFRVEHQATTQQFETSGCKRSRSKVCRVHMNGIVAILWKCFSQFVPVHKWHADETKVRKMKHYKKRTWNRKCCLSISGTTGK